MSLFSTISYIARDFRDARARYLTERQIGSLPFEIQKDIGWPAEDELRAKPRTH